MPTKAKEKKRKRQKAYRIQLRLEMIKAYGGKCKYCGEKDPDVLVLDHINDDGYIDRSKKGIGSGVVMYANLRKQGWPQDRLQLLCANCNTRKEMKRRRDKVPSVSKKQRNFMAAAAHNPKFAKKAGIPVSVAKEFNAADKGKKFKSGGDVADKSKLKKLFKGKDTYGEELKEAKAIKSGKITPKEYAKGEKMEGIHGMKCGGKTKAKTKTKCMASGGAVNVGGKSLPPAKYMGSLGLRDGGDPAAKLKQFKEAKDAFKNADLQAEMTGKARKDKTMLPKPQTTVDKTYNTAPKSIMGEDVDAPAYRKGGLAKANGKAIRGKTKGRII